MTVVGRGVARVWSVLTELDRPHRCFQSVAVRLDMPTFKPERNKLFTAKDRKRICRKT